MTRPICYPRAAVIVLNYNGQQYIERCLRSLLHLKYPPDRLELIVVDNASPDGSADLVAQVFPEVRLIRNPANWGFARGNNVGIRASHAEYVALLNNDTEVEPDWLAELVRVAEEDARIGACTSKIQLFHRRLELALTMAPVSDPAAQPPPGDVGPGVLIERATVVGKPDRAVERIGGLVTVQTTDGPVWRTTADPAILGVPIEDGDEGLEVRLDLGLPRDTPSPSVAAELRVRGVASTLAGGSLARGGRPSWHVRLGASELAHARPVLQNVGSLIFPDGSGRDRGAMVQGTHVYYETDRGQYDAVEEVFAACGASALLRRAMLEDVGLLDERLFLYYEDTDLSWRMRLRGWKVVYVPRSVARHVHCGSSVEWSELFLFQTDRNRLAVLAKNGMPGQIVRAWGRYLLGTARLALGAARAVLRWPVSGSIPPVGRRLWIRLRVLASLARALPGLVWQRRMIQGRRTVGPEQIARWFEPAGGRWVES